MTKNIAHRGARSLAPENTMAAVKRAFDLGADLWETDVSVTKDEALILFHDNSLERTTNATTVFPGRPSYLFTEFTLAEILALSAGSYFEATDPAGEIAAGNVSRQDLDSFKTERVPTLEEALVFTRDNNWQVNLELKDLPGGFNAFPLPQRTLEMIKRIGIGLDQFVISSFNHTWLKQVQALAPMVQVQALLGDLDGEILDFKDYHFETYNLNHTSVDEQTIQDLKLRKKKINLFTVNDTRDMNRFLKAGVDGIITDFPQRLAAILK
ncbi:GlpQ1 [Desulforapulum autotrophicum HRM2]|uniref:GlpQ1 n=1 Tax=Desulforapulum autotrophicum (strain ATCC 43914 / DSM 3382 / VKM B-1955 / HRM2) TaxID=177437 RepID=C0QBY9_DESAH|nr:glycerophosphodiester phosphodiesterase family protein [Desulforapulum autotrophicum]ACN15001.1 GlpQ1 [Desulforapulum autotrophicum HRM2]